MGKQVNSRCLMVLGMHRSGTSAMTRCLNLLGMDVGSHLLSPDEGNARGYWEHADAVRINDTLLSAFGLHWYSLDPLPDDWLRSEAADMARAEIKSLVHRDFPGVPLWGLKDPRMCRLAPLWIETLQSLGISVSAIFMMRSPLEVADSLQRAQGIAKPLGILSWMLHLAEAEIATRELSRTMIHYDQLLEQPLEVLEAVGRDLDLSWPMLVHERLPALEAFLDRGMRSHREPVDQGKLPSLVEDMVEACNCTQGWAKLPELTDRATGFFKLLTYRRQYALPDENANAEPDEQLFRAEPVYAELYHATGEEAFSAERVDRRPVSLGRTRIEWALKDIHGQRYRVDPVDKSGYYVLHSLQLLDERGAVEWDWEQCPEQIAITSMYEIERSEERGGRLYRTDGDPQMLFTWPAEFDVGRLRLVLEIERPDAGVMGSEYEATKAMLAQSQAEMSQKQSHWEKQRDELCGRLRDAWSAVGKLEEDVDHKLDALHQQVVRQKHVLERLQQYSRHQESVIRALMRRGLVSKLRRRFQRISFQLVPLQQLEALEGDGARWRITGDDPIFACGSSRYPMAPGWYLVDLHMRQHDGEPARACLYPDCGPGIVPNPAGLQMPFVREGQVRHRGFVYLPHPVDGLRLDPANAPCSLTIDQFSMRRTSRARAGMGLLFAAVRDARARYGIRWALRETWSLLRTKGVRGAVRHWCEAPAGTPPSTPMTYALWLATYDHIEPQDIKYARQQCEHWDYRPVISVLVPTYETDEKYLRRCIESVRSQAYPYWQLCVADDASPSATVMKVLREFEESDERIRLVQRTENGHIAATTNSALALADGEYVALLDHDDELHPLALYEVVKALQENRGWKLIYTDEDKIDLEGQRYDPYMKPDWNYELLLSQNCISHLGVYQRQLVEKIGGFREGYEGSQDWDLALRCIEHLTREEIGHIPRVLYHWRAIPGSTAVAVGEKNYAREAAERAIGEHLDRMQAGASVEEIHDRPGNFRLRFPLPEKMPKVSVVIPTRDGLHLLKQCVNSILERSTYENYEIIIVDNQSVQEETLQYLERVVENSKVRVLTYDYPFNYSALNNYAVDQSDGDIIALLNNDIEVITPGWLEEMVSHAIRPDIGAVGAMLYYPDDTIQHAGVVLGVHGVAAHIYSGMPYGYPGQMGRACLCQSMSAVTAACLVIRKEVYGEVGGLDEGLQVAFNDVDFCLRVRDAGYRNLWTPFAELYHYESATRGHEDSPGKIARFQSEVDRMRERWGEALSVDPAYSPNLTLSGPPFDLAFPPRAGFQRQAIMDSENSPGA